MRINSKKEWRPIQLLYILLIEKNRLESIPIDSARESNKDEVNTGWGPMVFCLYIYMSSDMRENWWHVNDKLLF